MELAVTAVERDQLVVRASFDYAPVLEHEPTAICVTRSDERVRYRAIPPGECEALAAAMDGETFAAICERVAEEVGEADAARRAAELLGAWVADGLIAGIAD